MIQTKGDGELDQGGDEKRLDDFGIRKAEKSLC
jgi:hypothetical protein